MICLRFCSIVFFFCFFLDGKCTGWKIALGAAVFFAVLFLLGLAWAVRKLRQPIQGGVAPEVADVENEPVPLVTLNVVENAGDRAENGDVNRSKKCGSKGTLDVDDDVPMVTLT